MITDFKYYIIRNDLRIASILLDEERKPFAAAFAEYHEVAHNLEGFATYDEAMEVLKQLPKLPHDRFAIVTFSTP